MTVGPILRAGFVLLALVAGCNRQSLDDRGCDDPTDCPESCDDPNDCTNGEYVSFVVLPSAPTLTSTDGSQPTQQFNVYGQRQDGSRSSKPLSATFEAPSNPIGSIDGQSGLFMASGEVGGTLSLAASISTSSMPVKLNFQITVKLERTYYAPGAPSDAGSHFGVPPTADAAKGAGLVYPLDGVVMPQNVFPADIQWQNGVAGDLYKITIRKTDVTLVAYTLHKGAGFTFDYLPEAKGWTGVTQSDPDDDALLTVDRFEAATGNVYGDSAPVKMHFANGSLLGSIYYWDIAAGRIRRIDDGSNKNVDFMPNPPTSPIDNSVCVGCHAVSRDGRYMLGRLGGGSNVAGVFDLTRDLTGSPAPSEYSISAALPQFFISSWSPDNARLIGSNYNQLTLIDPKSGMSVAPNGVLPSDGAYPNWSPDGQNIAYISSANDWGGELTQGNLSILPVTAPDTFGAPKMIHSAASIPGRTADMWPTWTPDAKWIAFHSGTDSRSDDGMPGALYLIDPNGGNLVRMTNATGGNAGNETVFVPNFSPFNKGGYYWLTFISRRAYGNSAVGTAANPLQQLWVAAVRNDPQPGQDPSCVPYWLPGQSTVAKNITAFWAPKACRVNGDSCTVGSDCCSTVCSMGKCQIPPPELCRKQNQTCGGNGDCCDNLPCNPMTHICDGTIG